MTETEEINARFDAMIARGKLSSDIRDEEIVVRQLAWKRDTDALLHEREASTEAHRMAIEAHRSVIVANTELAEQARVMIATRHEDAGELSLHRERLESIYREGFADITNALKALTTPTVLAEAHDAMGMNCEAVSGVVRCTRRFGHTGNHGNDYLRQEWS